MKILILLLVALVAGCGATQPAKPDIVRVEVPVKVPCIDQDKIPQKPARRYGVGDWPGQVEAVKVLIADLEAAEQYGTDWEAAAAGCSKPSNTPAP